MLFLKDEAERENKGWGWHSVGRVHAQRAEARGSVPSTAGSRYSAKHSRGVGGGRGLSFSVLLSSTGRSLRLAWAMACLLEGELRREGSRKEEKEENA